MSFIHAQFAFPDGGIYGNILASVIVGVVVYFWKVKGWLRKVEVHHQKIHELHERMVIHDSSNRVLPQPGGPT